MRASKMVCEAPGVVSSHVIDRIPPPAATRTILAGLAWIRRIASCISTSIDVWQSEEIDQFGSENPMHCGQYDGSGEYE